MASKGVVYFITGALTCLAAFNLGGKKAGKSDALSFIDNQAFGNVLLLILAVGLFCYVFWRGIQAIQDPENIGSDKKGKVKRAAFFVSAVIYGALAVSAVMRVVSNSSGGSGSKPGSSLLTGDVGVVLFFIIGLSIIGAAVNQFHKVYTKKFLEKFNYKSITDSSKRKVIKNTGMAGLSSRGILFLILGYFFIRAAIESNTNNIKNTKDAFSFLENSSYGSILLGVVAAGLVCYSIYMFMMSRYRKFDF
ncbi:membrane protein [Neptunitalea sp. Y10]|uniref:Membrane protein n=2 Tax=Neptunitalea lumnitzerae TaxID=2965509 RepID=A0ABQ5MHL6_9FLAO|nr:membrane protein [Neptunitalea sp. Y10]